MPTRWPEEFPVVQVIVARPTDRLDEVVRFYRDALGLEQVGSFEGSRKRPAPASSSTTTPRLLDACLGELVKRTSEHRIEL